MFGTFRLLLALMVVWFHLFDFDGIAGPMAVFGFFCLSGYLMTKVVNETYADGIGGFSRYLANRALRIYPSYYVALVCSAAALSVWPAVAADLTAFYVWPPNLLPQLTVVGLVPGSPRILPAAWSLHFEIIYYIAIGALLGRSRRITVIWFLASVEAVVALRVMHGEELWYLWYQYTFLGNSIAFAAGAMIYHFRDRLTGMTWKSAAVAALLLLAVGVLLPHDAKNAAWLYAGLLFAAIAVAALKNVPRQDWDSRLGNLAYPVFLIHHPMAVAVHGLLDRTVATSLLAVVLSIGAAFVLYCLVERPIERWRAPLRARSAALTPAERTGA